MQVNKIGAEDVIGWFKSAIDAGARRPGAVFGAAMLQLLLWMVLMMGLGLVLVVATAAGSGGSQDEAVLREAMSGYLYPTVLGFTALMLVLNPILGGGMVQALHNAETGAPVSALDAFAGFRGPVLFPLAGLAMVGVVAYLLSLAGQWVFGGPEVFNSQFTIWADLARGEVNPPPEPAMPIANFLWAFAVGLVNALVSLLVVPLVQLGRMGTLAAIVAAFRGLAANPGAMLLAALLGFAAILGTALVSAVLFVLVALVGLAIPALAILLGVLLAIALVAFFLVFYYAVCRAAWISLYTDGVPAAAAPPPTPGQIEV